MPLQPIPIEPEFAPRASGFEVQLEVFNGPFALLLHLIESRQLDILSVPLAEVADAFVGYLSTHRVEPVALSEFVAVAARLILIKSRRLLPGEPSPAESVAGDEPDEADLRGRLIAYRALRDAAQRMGELDLLRPLMRREPRDTDLPIVAGPTLGAGLLVEGMLRLAALREAEPAPPEVVAREITMAMQIAALEAALAPTGALILQEILGASRSRTEQTVTLMATLELVRRRVVRVEQAELFGPIRVELIR